MNASAQTWRLEQHVGTIMQALVIGLLAWSLKTNVDMRAEIAVLNAKLEAVQTTIAQGANDRYHGTDAARDFAAVWSEFNRINSRIEKLEAKHQ